MGDAERIVSLLLPLADDGNEFAARAIRMIEASPDPDRTALSWERGMTRVVNGMADALRSFQHFASHVAQTYASTVQGYIERVASATEEHANSGPR